MTSNRLLESFMDFVDSFYIPRDVRRKLDRQKSVASEAIIKAYGGKDA